MTIAFPLLVPKIVSLEPAITALTLMSKSKGTNVQSAPESKKAVQLSVTEGFSSGDDNCT